MEELELITESTTLVLGDWIVGRTGNTPESYSRLGAYSTQRKQWFKFKDGVDPFRNGDTVFTLTQENMIRDGYRKVVDRLSFRYADKPVYLVVPTEESDRPVEVEPGVDPTNGTFNILS